METTAQTEPAPDPLRSHQRHDAIALVTLSCACLQSLRVRIEALTNTTARTVMSQQLQLMDERTIGRRTAEESQTSRFVFPCSTIMLPELTVAPSLTEVALIKREAERAARAQAR